MVRALSLTVASTLMLPACSMLDLQPPTPSMLEAVRTYSNHGCNKTVASTMDALGFQAGDIQGIRWDRRETSNSEGNTVLQGYNAWVTFNNQPGYLIVSVRPSCKLMTYSTRSGAKIPNAELA